MYRERSTLSCDAVAQNRILRLIRGFRAEEGGSMEGKMERGLVAESTSFTQYKRGVHIGENENEKKRER